MAPRHISHYRILDTLGSGGMGEVYLAEDTRLHRRVAIKLLPSNFTQNADRVRRFEQEARAASALNHPNIVTIYDIGESDAGPFIAMEFVAGRTLRALAGAPVAIPTLADWGRQIVEALASAHEAGIVHRDIKPDNIMVRDDGYVKVLDFGLARLAPKEDLISQVATAAATHPGALVGTLRYMAPEQAAGAKASAAADMFALGVVLYELATGRHPLAADTLLAFVQALATAAPTPPSRIVPAIPAAFDALVLHLLDRDERRRPSARETVAALSAVKDEERGTVVPSIAAPRASIVGREKERASLESALEAAAAGRGSLLCVAGEPGIGKTTLVEGVLGEVTASGRRYRIARGRCSERLAGTEAYLPWLEALDALRRDESGAQTLHVMRRIAPTWFAQVARGDESSEALLAELKSASQERLKRELALLLEELSRERPLVLFFDDLHWSDISTIDLLAYLAGRFGTLRLLIVATYRPSDLALARHPFVQLKRDLQARGVCREVELGFLERSDVERYLDLQFACHEFPRDLSLLIHEKTEGSPLFMVDLVKFLRDRGVIAEEGGRWRLTRAVAEIELTLPESVQGMIQRKIDQLDADERRLLATAAVQGYEFDSAVVSDVLRLDPGLVEERLQRLDQQHALVRFVDEREFPDQTLTARYRFVHVLYQNALYASLTSTRRVAESRSVAEALLRHYGDQSEAMASQLAALFEAARDFARAAEYSYRAVVNAARVFAYQEVIALAQRGLKLLNRLPESTDRARRERELQLALGNALIVAKGYAADEVREAFERARLLCEQQPGEQRELFRALRGIWYHHVVRGNFEHSLRLAHEQLALAEALQDRGLLLEGSLVVGLTACYLARFTIARTHLERGIDLYDPRLHADHRSTYTIDPGVSCRRMLAWVLWFEGHPDRARARAREALEMADQQGHHFTIVYVCFFCAIVYMLRGGGEAAAPLVERALALATDRGFPAWDRFGTVLQGWVLAEQGGASQGALQMRRALADYERDGSRLPSVFFRVVVADAYLKAGNIDEGLKMLAEASECMAATGECVAEAELHRLKGELLLRQGAAPAAVEECFHQALTVARAQGAKSWELRAATSLARLWVSHGRRSEARELLKETYNWFTEGHDTRDLREAKALLDELAPAVPTVSRPAMVGRDKERTALRAAFEAAAAGRGSLMCVAGEPGIGKTTLVEDVLTDLAASGRPCRIARGRCSERLAGTEAYLPWLEALDALRRDQHGLPTMHAMRRIAPTWLAQVGRGDESSNAALIAELKSASQERLKRELALLLEELSRDRLLVLFFDDLHWADVSTVDLLGFVANRLSAMRLVIVATYRPTDLLLAKHPFLQLRPDLQARGICHELPLDFLTQADIARYLDLRFPGHRFPPELPALIHAKTEGSPLFMADLVRYLHDSGVIAGEHDAWVLAQALPVLEGDLPESVRGMIERKIAQVSEDDRRLLVAASVYGHQFDSAVLARALGADQAQVEEQLDALERVHALVQCVADEELPDRTLTLRYRFVHVLYHGALDATLRSTRRVALSRAIADALLAYYGDQRGRVAPALANLLEVSRDFGQAADYFLLAAQNATRVFANHEAIALARRGLDALALLPDSPARARQEVALQLTLGWPLINVRGYAAREVEQTYTRARELCECERGDVRTYQALWGLAMCYLNRGQYGRTRELGTEILRLAEEAQDPAALVTARYMLGTVLVYLGEIASAREHYVQGAALSDTHRELTLPDGRHPGVACRAQMARVLWLLGYPEQALEMSEAAQRDAQRHPHDLAFTLFLDMLVRQFRREIGLTEERAEQLKALADEHVLPMYRALGGILHGWARARSDGDAGITEMRQSLTAYEQLGNELSRPHFLALLAEALGNAGRREEALLILVEALAAADRTNERYYEAELHRLNGELLLRSESDAQREQAEECFQRALDVARRQQARSLELRAATSLARLWLQEGKHADGRALVAGIYHWFTEGFEQADLRDARALIAPEAAASN